MRLRDVPPNRVFHFDGWRLAQWGDGDLEAYGRTHEESHGTENLDLLLKPRALADAFTFREARDVQYEGRPAVRLRAVPILGDRFTWSVPGLVVTGAHDYVITVDASYGIVLEVEVFADGQTLRRHTLCQLQVDVNIDDALFKPPVTP